MGSLTHSLTNAAIQFTNTTFMFLDPYQSRSTIDKSCKEGVGVGVGVGVGRGLGGGLVGFKGFIIFDTCFSYCFHVLLYTILVVPRHISLPA